MEFASDNTAGLSAEVSEALLTEGARFGPAYGGDQVTRDLDRLFSDLFGTEVRAFPVSSGTAANGLALACVSVPHTQIRCAQGAHLATDEATGPEAFTACRLTELPNVGGLIDAAGLEAKLGQHARPPHSLFPTALSVTQATETGQLYPLERLRGISRAARGHGLKLHMDGARFANALARLKATPAEGAWKVGVDVLSFGASKNGAAADAVIFFDLKAAERFERTAKRFGHTLCKTRLLSAQLAAHVHDGRWLRRAENANARAQELAAGLAGVEGMTLLYPVETNMLFVRMSLSAEAALRARGARFFVLPSDDGHVTARLVTNFQTSPDEVGRLLDAARDAA